MTIETIYTVTAFIMIKKLLGFTLLLVAIGTGFSLYLPEYQATDITPPQNATQLVESSLNSPVQADSLHLSSSLFSPPKETVIYGLQLGLFGTLSDAQFKGNTLYQQAKHVIQPPISIFKVKDNHRTWYVLALGALDNRTELEKYTQLLQDQGIKSQEILWPFDKKAD